jgi:hypothetical protein
MMGGGFSWTATVFVTGEFFPVVMTFVTVFVAGEFLPVVTISVTVVVAVVVVVVVTFVPWIGQQPGLSSMHPMTAT